MVVFSSEFETEIETDNKKKNKKGILVRYVCK